MKSINKDLYEEDIRMTVSDEDLGTLILGLMVSVTVFFDLSQASFIFPVLFFVLAGYGITRFRRRPLPWQIQEMRFKYLGIIKIAKFYNLLSIIFMNFLYVFGYLDNSTVGQTDGLIYRFIPMYNAFFLFFLIFLEFFGHLFVSDELLLIPKVKGEDERELRNSRNRLLYGLKFRIWLCVTGLIVLGMFFAIGLTIRVSGSLVVLILQIIPLIGGGGLTFYFYKKTYTSAIFDDSDMILSAVEYYKLCGLPDEGYSLLLDYLKVEPTHITILNKLSVMELEKGNYEQVLNLTKVILEETEQKEIKVPHLIANAYLLRALSYKAQENYQKAYEQATRSLKYNPDNQLTRKARRDIRKYLDE